MAATNKPLVVLGLMTFGPPATDSVGARITDIDQFNRALDVFKARGYNKIDIARTYNGSKQESFTKQTGWNNKGFILSTKVKYPREDGANEADKVVESVETSLQELGVESIDTLYLHCPDRATPFSETLGAIDKLHKAGKFRRFGLSNFSAAEVAEVVMTCKYNGWIRPTVYQAMYNAITRNVEPELLVILKRYGIDVLAYNPLVGGLFSGKIKSAEIEPGNGRYSKDTPIGQNYRARYFKDSTFRALQEVESAVGKHEGLTLVETAFRWLVHHSQLDIKGGKDGIVIGVSNLEQLDTNLDAIEKGPLPNDVVEALDRAWYISKPDSPHYWQKDLGYKYDTAKALFED